VALLLETISLDLEESSELLFKIKIEGAEPSPAKVRLVCETGDVAYMFNGHPTQDEGVVQFLLPALSDKLKEGTYLSRVEVLIENRYFSPVAFNINLKKAVSVMAEVAEPPRHQAPQVTVTASQIVVKKREAPPPPPPPAPRPIIIEEQSKPAQRPIVASRPVQKPAAPSTLKERYAKQEVIEKVINEVDDDGEDLIRELAQSFARKKK